MGQSNATFLTKEDIKNFEETTFFTRSEIFQVFRYFERLTLEKEADGFNPLKKAISPKEFMAIPELCNNPFRERIARIYSRNETQTIGFEEFIDFFSVFSEEATKDVKAFYAFKIYDHDEDGYIGREDAAKTVEVMVGSKGIGEKEIAVIVEKLFEEADIDGDDRLSFVEFEHIINRASNFDSLFRINIVEKSSKTQHS